MATEKLSVILELLAGQYKKEAKEAADATSKLSDSLGKTGQMASKVGTALTAGITLPLAGLAVGAVKAASNLAESMNAINVVFKDAADTVEAFGQTAADSAGLSQRAFNEAVIPIGQLLNNFGFEANASADAVLALTQRAADLGSVLNVDTAVALQKFQAGLAGEAEPLKAFGVDVSVAAIKQEALALGLIRSGEEMSKSVRAQAALSIIMRETAFAAGDFANTLGESLPNQLKALKADAENVAAALGTAMLPAVLDVVKGIKGLVDRFTELSAAQQEFVVKTGLTVGALGPALFVAGKLVLVYKNLRNAILALNLVLGLGSGGGLIAGFKLLGTAILGTPLGALAAITAAAYGTATGLRAVLDVETDLEAQTHIQERAWSARDAQVRSYEAGLKDVSKSGTDLKISTQDLVEVHDSWMTGLANVQAGLSGVVEESSEARLKALELAEANRAAAKSFREDLTEAIAGFVTFFDGAVKEIGLSLKELEAQFEARRTQNERFWNGLAVLAAAGLDDLVAELQAQGPEVAGVVEELVADMDRAFEWERRIEESRRQAAAMANALANGLAGETDTVGAAFNRFGISLARQLEAGFSTADLRNTLTQLMDLADQFGGGVTTPGDRGRQQFAGGGVVQGARLGEPTLVVAHVGETILPTQSSQALSPMSGSIIALAQSSSTTFNTRYGSPITLVSPVMNNFSLDLQTAALYANHMTFGKF